MTNLIALPTGTELVGDYRIERVLGAGGFGITYLADEMALERAVTIKEYFPSDFAARNSSHEAVPRSQDCSKDYRWGLDRFIEEAQTLARFDHPNIVRVYRYFRANNTGYMVLQWEEGQSLKSWLKQLNRAPRQKELDEIIAPLLEALEMIHKADFLHRDIAPDNIIVRKSGSPVLIDFGSARGEIAAHSKTVSALVKPGYSPYEQYAETSRKQGPWTDIYALGATLYHAVTGKRPPDAPSRMVHDELVPARDTALGAYRQSFLAAIDRALSIEIRDRPQSVAAWRGDLLAPEQPRQGWLTKALEKQREEDAKAELERDAARRASADVTTPPPPDAPGPQGGLLDFLDRLGGAKPAAAKADAAKQPDAAAKPANGKVKPTPKPKSPAKAAPPAKAVAAKPAPKAPASSPAPAATVVLAPSEQPAALNLKKKKPTPLNDKPEEAKVAGPPAAVEPAKPVETPAAPKPAAPKGEIVPARQRTGLFTRGPRPKPRPEPAKAKSSPRLPPIFVKFAIGACVATLAVMLQNRLPDITDKTQELRPTAAAPAPPISPQLALVTAHDGGANLLQYGSDGSRLYSVGGDHTLKVWMSADLSLVNSIPLEQGTITSLAVRGDSALIGHADGRIDLWDVAAASKRATFQRNEADIWSLAFAGTDTRFLTATHDWKVALWDAAQTSAPVHVFDGHENAVQAIAYAPNGDLIASGGADRTVRLWNLTTRDLVRTYRGARAFITSIAISHDSKLIAAASIDGSIRVWSATSRRQRQLFSGHQGAVNQISFAPDNRRLVSAGSDGTVRLWDLGRRRAIRAYSGHKGDVKAAQFAPDGTRIATAGGDGTVRIWSAMQRSENGS